VELGVEPATVAEFGPTPRMITGLTSRAVTGWVGGAVYIASGPMSPVSVLGHGIQPSSSMTQSATAASVHSASFKYSVAKMNHLSSSGTPNTV
jgi:hypothetical protein